MNVLGIDMSTFAIDLVLLDENEARATWHRVNLDDGVKGELAWDRVRRIADRMPSGSFWDDVYLASIERPFSQSRKDPIRLVQGAVMACVPARLDLWECAPQTWKAHLKFKGRGKPTLAAFPPIALDAHQGSVWADGPLAQDAVDALGVALWARDTNAQLISDALSAA